MTFIILKTATFVQTCAYAKLSIQKPMVTLSLVLVLARSPRVQDTALAHHSGLRHQEEVQGYVCVCVCAMGNHLPHPRVALQHSSSIHKWQGTNDAAQHKSASSTPQGSPQHLTVFVYFADFFLYVHIFPSRIVLMLFRNPFDSVALSCTLHKYPVLSTQTRTESWSV